jgi:hypothetical protein
VSYRLLGNDKESKSKAEQKALRRAMEDVEEGTEVAFEAIRELLIAIEKPSNDGSSGWTPKHTGLQQMTSAKDGTTAWVSEVSLLNYF